MKEEYKAAEVEIIRFEMADIVTVSCTGDEHSDAETEELCGDAE